MNEIINQIRPGCCYAATEWELTEEQVALCLRPDGSKHVLGQGSYGVVYKGVLRGEAAVHSPRCDSAMHASGAGPSHTWETLPCS